MVSTNFPDKLCNIAGTKVDKIVSAIFHYIENFLFNFCWFEGINGVILLISFLLISDFWAKFLLISVFWTNFFKMIPSD